MKSPFPSLREPVHAAFHSLRAHKLRSALTTLGIIVGVASVITVVHLMKSLEGRIMADVNRQGSHTYFLRPYVPMSVWKKGAKVRFQSMDAEQIRELRDLVPEIQLASPSYEIWQAQVKAGANNVRASLNALDENGLELSGLDLDAGRGFTPTDRITRAPVVVLGSKLAEDLDLGEASLGKTLTINGRTAELIGILRKQGDIPFLPQDDEADAWGPDNQAYIPFGAFKELADPWSMEDMAWRLQVDDHVPVPVAEDLLKTGLRRIRGLKGEDPDNFRVETNRKEVEKLEKLSRTLMIAFGAMVSVSLLVGGIGVMNIMLVSVTERTREIGLRKALGARRRVILVQFLVESVILCVVGGVIGAALGLALGTVLSQLLMKMLGTVPLWALVSALAMPALVGILFGLYPAHRASKLDPIEALRYE